MQSNPVPCSSSGFHTTQYDLNIKHSSKPDSNRCEFPYYIVRFKLVFIFVYFFLCLFCFHTTQYDLNSIGSSQTYTKRLRFPYYIVRFKPVAHYIHTGHLKRFHTTQYDLNERYLAAQKAVVAGFHTTQYDLNKIGLEVSNTVASFHTTQYDLNICFVPYFIDFSQVSILHSTI